MQAATFPSPIYNEGDPTTQIFVCPLCCDLAIRDPAITHCQHIFCRECIATALNQNSQCPMDRGSLSMSQVSPLTGPLKQIWLSIKVQCRTCTLWGPLESYEPHIRICKRWDEEQVKKLQDELASTAFSQRLLTTKLSKTNERNKRLERALVRTEKNIKFLKTEFGMVCMTQELEELALDSPAHQASPLCSPALVPVPAPALVHNPAPAVGPTHSPHVGPTHSPTFVPAVVPPPQKSSGWPRRIVRARRPVR
jgi:Zinc finger, C3HC4 type (RING finger)